MFNNSSDIIPYDPNSLRPVSYFDLTIRMISLIIHIIYFIILLKVKNLQTRTYIYMHHVNFISLFYILHYVVYFNNRTVILDHSSRIIHILCETSEIVWGVQKLLRTYSILLLAFYRYLAVYNQNLYRKLNKTPIFIFTSIAITWIFSLAFTYVFKIVFSSTHSKYFCSPGYSNIILNIIIYFVLVNLICNILPIVLILLIYIRITDKLQLNKKKLGVKIEPYSSDPQQKLKQKEIKFAKQIILMNIFTVMSSALSIVVNFQIVLASHEKFDFLDNLFADLRPVFRGLFLIFQTSIPVLSILYNPDVNVYCQFSKFILLLKKFF
ncbi:unnamed protein product [Brachionus calyciflorus]|uniref:G-protein coupled receptors family 1 profile domain-containing protein n=1 Tax=Brachionus calyciflorus TaxID=104777 RepID=A0A814GUW7_9BILA|nr:unnamed protein product [Brachionus calyciflorus]